MKQKTVTIKLSDLISEHIATREAVNLVSDKIPALNRRESSIFELDFSNVDFISRSFADELFVLKEFLKRRDIVLDFVNTSSEAEKMLDIVLSQREHHKKPRKVDLRVKELSKIAYQF